MLVNKIILSFLSHRKKIIKCFQVGTVTLNNFATYIKIWNNICLANKKAAHSQTSFSAFCSLEKEQIYSATLPFIESRSVFNRVKLWHRESESHHEIAKDSCPIPTSPSLDWRLDSSHKYHRLYIKMFPQASFSQTVKKTTKKPTGVTVLKNLTALTALIVVITQGLIL